MNLFGHVVDGVLIYMETKYLSPDAPTTYFNNNTNMEIYDHIHGGLIYMETKYLSPDAPTT